jgi:acyl-CoA dehydrogenase
LVPAATPGIEQGARHDPLHMAFLNGPLKGRDVFIPIEQIIGGVAQAGNGWRMLIESLTDGRAISLPALSTAAAKTASRITGAYARIRRQFGVSIASFEGIEEALARIAGHTYAMDAARRVTLAALDAGHKPAVISAIVKYNLTYRCRQVIDAAMEVYGGAGICLGPSNPLGQLHSFPAVGITVEGANILTRNLITFGQGAIRCHPYLLNELKAAGEADEKAGLRAFDRALLGHLGFALSNAVRSLLLGLSGAWLAPPPADAASPVRRYYRRLTRMSAAFAIVTDVLLLMLRGGLKRRERLSARMADVLSQLYLASTALKHFADQDQQADDLPLVRWVCEDCLYTIQQSFDVLFDNLPNRAVAWGLRLLVFPLGRHYAPPADRLEQDTASLLTAPSPARDRLSEGMYLPEGLQERVAKLERALQKIIAVEPLERKLKEARRHKQIRAKAPLAQLDEALAAGVLTETEAKALREAEKARREIIQVDHFPASEATVMRAGGEHPKTPNVVG